MPLSGAKNATTLRLGSDGFRFAGDNRRADGRNAALGLSPLLLLDCRLSSSSVTNQVCVARETRAKLLAMTEQGSHFVSLAALHSPLPRDSESARVPVGGQIWGRDVTEDQCPTEK